MNFFIHTYGCQMNVRDSEAVTALLAAEGHVPVQHEIEADLVIINSCSVRGKAEDKAIGKLRMLVHSKNTYPQRLVGVMGCMVSRLDDEILKLVPGLDFGVGTRAAYHIPRLVSEAMAGAEGQILVGAPDNPDVPHQHMKGGLSAFVTVLLGCNRRCSYCIVPDVRGPEMSRKPEEILSEARQRLSEGVKEITLLGQSVLNYGRQPGVDLWENMPASPAGYSQAFPRLLEAVAGLPGLKRLRFTTGHPSGCGEELAHAMATLPQVAPHLHLPVQSGSDAVLKRMRRGYTVESYLAAVERLKKHIPDCSITTDIIVGFPGETDDDFQLTRDLFRKVEFDNSYIFKYSPRPGTPAAAWEDDVPTRVKEERNRILLQDQDEIGEARNRRWLDRRVEVLAEGPSLRDESNWSGRSGHNKIVIFKPFEGLKAGDMVEVKVDRARPQTLYGNIGINDE